MSPIRRLLREPLVHFLAAGCILFGALVLFRGESLIEADSRTIAIERRDLLTFLQYRANAFEPETFGAALDAMTDTELQEVIDAYIDEEILYREAVALGLEQSDNIIRQRMVQKMNFLLADTVAASGPADSGAIEAWFEANRESYAIAPWATFTHVFFDATRHGEEGARQAADETLRELNATGAGFNDATAFGDRFPYLRNYVERTFEFVASHFGTEFAAGLAGLEPSASEWQGPLRSAFGEHVVLLTRSEERAYPELADIRDAVERDFGSEQSTAVLEEWSQSIRDLYRIDIGEIR